MGIDVIICGSCEAIASRPSEELIDWLEGELEDYNIRYGYVALDESDAARLEDFADDPVRSMLIEKVADLRTRGLGPPYLIELMISA